VSAFPALAFLITIEALSSRPRVRKRRVTSDAPQNAVHVSGAPPAHPAPAVAVPATAMIKPALTPPATTAATRWSGKRPPATTLAAKVAATAGVCQALPRLRLPAVPASAKALHGVICASFRPSLFRHQPRRYLRQPTVTTYSKGRGHDAARAVGDLQKRAAPASKCNAPGRMAPHRHPEGRPPDRRHTRCHPRRLLYRPIERITVRERRRKGSLYVH
jgi:hypothetical protein